MNHFKLRNLETKKLHYGKFLYKLAIHNPYALYFRTEFQKGNLEYIKEKLKDDQINFDTGMPIYRTIYRSEVAVSDQDFLDAKTIYTHLKSGIDFKVRVERYNGLCLYSNDKGFLLDLSDKIPNSAKEFWKPNKSNVSSLLSIKNIIIVDKEPDLKYKVTFNSKPINPSFGKWLSANTDKSRVGKYTLDNICIGYANNSYIFIRDTKVLTMIELIVGHNIRKVEELIYKPNIDK